MDLSTIIKSPIRDLYLKNPVIAASGTFGSGLEYQPYGDISSLGGIAVKGFSLKPRPGNPMPRIAETTAGMLNSIGLQNDGLEFFIDKTLPRLPWKETAIIANIYGASCEEIGEICEKLNDERRIAALELNVSCPNVKEGGAVFGSSAKSCFRAVSAARKGAPGQHLIVKLSPNVTDIAEIAKSAEDAGADSLSCINTVAGMAIDAKKRKPLLANVIGGLSGPAIKPIALRCAWQTARAVKIPVIGLGGISSAMDIAEFLLAGASAVQIGTANFSRPDAIFQIVRDLPKTLEELGANSVSELVGALQAS